jgi:hypothetical protein
MSVPADRLGPVFAAAEEKIKAATWVDHYEILRDVPVKDNRGGETMTESVVESDRCLLQVVNRVGAESAGGSPIIQGITPYRAKLPSTTVLKDTDRLRINGRKFDVVSIARGGLMAVGTDVELEEVS